METHLLTLVVQIVGGLFTIVILPIAFLVLKRKYFNEQRQKSDEEATVPAAKSEPAAIAQPPLFEMAPPGLTTVRGLSDSRRAARDVDFVRDGEWISIRMRPPGNPKGSVVTVSWPAFRDGIVNGLKEIRGLDEAKTIAFRLPEDAEHLEVGEVQVEAGWWAIVPKGRLLEVLDHLGAQAHW